MRHPTAKELQDAMTVIIRAVQSESLSEELKSDRRIAESNKPETVPKNSKLYRLDPLYIMMFYESASVFDALL